MVRLVECGEQDLAVRVDIAARVLMVIRHRVSTCGGGGRTEEREDAWGSEEVFH